MYFHFNEEFIADEHKMRKEDAKLAHKLWELVFDINQHPF